MSRCELVIHTDQCVSRFARRFAKAQMWLDNEVLKDSDPYVPFLTGNLARSGQRGTQIGSGAITYSAPYARRQYYNYPRKTRDKHPQATCQWFEKAKAIHLKKWEKGVDELVTE